MQQPISALSNLLKSGAAATAAALTGGGGGGGDVQAAAAAAAQAAAAAAGLPPPDQESIQRLAAVLSAAQQQSNGGSGGGMKVPPMTLPTAGAAGGLPLPFSPDLLWRYPNPFMPQPPPSPMESHLKVRRKENRYYMGSSELSSHVFNCQALNMRNENCHLITGCCRNMGCFGNNEEYVLINAFDPGYG